MGSKFPVGNERHHLSPLVNFFECLCLWSRLGESSSESINGKNPVWVPSLSLSISPSSVNLNPFTATGSPLIPKLTSASKRNMSI